MATDPPSQEILAKLVKMTSLIFLPHFLDFWIYPKLSGSTQK
jgi:hypothetical protein